MTLVGEGSYLRDTLAVKAAALTIRKSAPDAVVMIGTPAPSAEFIRLSRSLKFNGPFINLSFGATEALAEALGADAAGVLATQVVPSPFNADVPVVKHYQAAMRASDPQARFGYISLEGYLSGVFVTEALQRLNGEITRDGLLAMFARGIAFDLGGFALHFAPGQNFGSNAIFLCQLAADGSSRIIDRLPARNG